MRPFSSVTPSVRIHAGPQALERLPRELDRLNLRHAFVLCGRSVATRTPLLRRVQALAGQRYAGAYTLLGKDAPLDDVLEATAQARAAGADALIAIGAGSVLKAARVVAIFLAESGDPASLATQYPPDGPPVSPRLRAPKAPIFNVLTAATSSQHRGGAALKNPAGGPRLEYFDPKTRPVAIFWDADALLTAPTSLARSTGLGVFWRALMNVGAVREANPLVQASRLHALTLSLAALPRMADPHDVDARIDMCAAAMLQNRDEDDGGRPMDAHWVARAVYALGAALFNQAAQLDQGTTHALLTGPAIRYFGELCPDAVRDMARALSIPDAATSGDMAAIGDAVGQWFAQWGIPMRLRDFDISKDLLASATQHAMQNFNADRNRELSQHRGRLEAVLAHAW